MYAAVLEENQRKNRTFGLVLQLLPGIIPEDFIWSFDANRVLQVSIDARVPVTGANRAGMQNALDAHFGPGKVRLA